MYRSWLISLKLLSAGMCLSLSLGFSTSATWANQGCKRLIPSIAVEIGIPTTILLAMADVESRFEPYVLNHAGKTLKFTTSKEALTYVEAQIKQGQNNLDIGCLQINWKAHQRNFESPKELLSPEYNICYAAQFLKSLYQEFGTWAKAVAAYHSRKSEYSGPYLIKIANSLTIQSSTGGKIQHDRFSSHPLSHKDLVFYHSVRHRLRFFRNWHAVPSKPFTKNLLFISDGRGFSSSFADSFWSLLSTPTPKTDLLWQRSAKPLYQWSYSL